MRLFVLTGAGVSAESGLGVFRGGDGAGLWSRFDPMKLATPEAFAADPDEVHAFYNARRILLEAKDAAAKEAYEEAGVIGKVKRKPIGAYSYWKRLDRSFELLNVEVYPA